MWLIIIIRYKRVYMYVLWIILATTTKDDVESKAKLPILPLLLLSAIDTVYLLLLHTTSNRKINQRLLPDVYFESETMPHTFVARN